MGRLLRDVSISRKLTVTTAAASGIALLLASTAFVAYDRVSFGEGLARRLMGEADILAYNTATAVVFDDPQVAARSLAALQAEPAVRSAAVYDAQGNRFALYARGPGDDAALLPPALPPERVHGSGFWVEGGDLLVAEPVVFEGERVGTVLIRSDLAERSARLRRYAGIVATVSLGALLVAVLVGLLAQRAISDPILSLAQMTRRISEGSDLSLRVEPQGGDEVGVLVRTFNEMLERLERRDGELQRVQAELERRVEERTHLYEEAEQANRVKDQFLATLSHELRTPLNAIVGWTSLLVEGGLDQETHARAVESIARNARAQSRLIEDILDVSRIVSGNLRLETAPVDLAALAQSALDSVAPAAAAKEIGLEFEADPAVVVIGDGTRLRQVVWNLVSNAVKFTPRGGRVTVEVRRPNSHVEVGVRDTGMGIAADFLPHVFERFRQADASTTRTHGGLGLGLAIVRHLVELHGGTVSASSPGAGKGALFKVSLPLSPLSPPGGAPPPSEERRRWVAEPAPPERLSGLHVLVVEDEDDSREVICAALGRLGAEALGVASAEEALEAVAARPPDVIVSDIEMPGTDGYGFIRRLRALPADRGGAVPATALTAHARREDRLRSFQAGFQSHLPKPVDLDELAAVVAALARRSGASPAVGGGAE